MADKKKKDFSMRKKDKNPKGGMTKKGIERYNKETGSNLKPGVKGAADTPEKMRRKGYAIEPKIYTGLYFLKSLD